MRSRTPCPPSQPPLGHLSDMSNEEQDTEPPSHPPLVIKSWELSEMSNEEQDTPSPLHPLLVTKSCELS